MAFWDSSAGKIVYVKPSRIEGYPLWRWIDCGCCAGLEWGGEEPRECRDCNGSGRRAWHVPSGVYAEYPGGPFLGRQGKLE